MERFQVRATNRVPQSPQRSGEMPTRSRSFSRRVRRRLTRRYRLPHSGQLTVITARRAPPCYGQRHGDVSVHVSIDVSGERVVQGGAGPAGIRYGAALDFNRGQQVAGSGSNEDLGGALQVSGRQRPFFNGVPRHVDLVQQQFASHARQATRTERRGPHAVAFGGEDIRRSALGNLATFVQEDGFVEAAGLRHFEPSQVHCPRQDLGAGELAGRVARVWRVAEPHTAAPFLGGGGERDQVAGAAHVRPFPHAACIADYHDAQGGVERLVGLHQFEQLAADRFRVGRERHAQRCGVLAHAGPVALEGKKHAVDHADGAEDAPAGEQPYLSRREQLIGGIPDFFIVENETVHKTSFYRRGTGLLACLRRLTGPGACPTGDTLAWCCYLRSFYWPPTHMMW